MTRREGARGCRNAEIRWCGKTVGIFSGVLPWFVLDRVYVGMIEKVAELGSGVVA